MVICKTRIGVNHATQGFDFTVYLGELGYIQVAPRQTHELLIR